MEGIKITDINNNGFYASIDSSIALLIQLFFNTSYENEKQSYDKSYLSKVKEKIDLWIQVSLKTRIDIGLNTNHPIKYDFNGKEITLFAKSGLNDSILIQVFDLYELIKDSLESEGVIYICKSDE